MKRRFLFPNGRAWTITQGAKGRPFIAELASSEKAVLLFSDEDLAATYLEKREIPNAKVAVLDGAEAVNSFLEAQQKRGVAWVVLDIVFGRAESHATRIEEVINHLKEEGQD